MDKILFLGHEYTFMRKTPLIVIDILQTYEDKIACNTCTPPYIYMHDLCLGTDDR